MGGAGALPAPLRTWLPVGSRILDGKLTPYSSSGNVGYIVGGYRYPTTVGTGGRFVLALRGGPDGRWLIAADLDNSGPPPAR
jgi:hypothetical protein